MTPSRLTSTLTAPEYFVAEPEPLRMEAGLRRFGSDFGNGPMDRLFFQLDSQAPSVASEKARIMAHPMRRLQMLDDPDAQQLIRSAGRWMVDQARRDGLFEERRSRLAPRGLPPLPEDPTQWVELSHAIQEDFALLHRPVAGKDRLVLLSVCFPSGWRPERLLGKGFGDVHAPVPEFESVTRKQSALTRAMVQRGPYVRFVWTLVADARLDHHPEHAPRDSWFRESRAHYRVERQVIVPLPEVDGSLFLIRTYVTPTSKLAPEKRTILRAALASMSPAIRKYKGLDSPWVDECLARSA